VTNTRRALRDISRHKSRSLLTILGIAVGIGLVLSLGSISEGLNAQIQQQFNNVAANIRLSATDEVTGITSDDIDAISNIPGVVSVIPVGTYDISRRIGGRDIGGFANRGFGGGGLSIPGVGGGGSGGFFRSIEFTAINPSDLDSLIGGAIGVIQGRTLDESDDGNEVVLLGYSAASNQNLNVGDQIEYDKTYRNSTKVDSYYFDVVGILEQTGTSSVDGAVYVPLSTMQEIEDNTTIESAIVNVASVDITENLTTQINNQVEDVRGNSPLAMIRQIQSSLGSIQLALIGIGAVAVFVGGLGIMNTMIMSVMERRRDMGIMKALGATRRTIIMQVVQESVILSLLGGFSALVVAYMGVSALPVITGFTGILTLNLVILGFAFALILGIGAGVYPALQASKLDPVEVLRYE
jgi:putative ABC transport system permease protein